MNLDQTAAAQNQQLRKKIAVHRFKSSQETPERRNIVKDLSTNLAAAMRENVQFEIPDDAAVNEAIQDEGLKPDGLLKQKQCYTLGKALKVDYVVVGSALLQGVKWHAGRHSTGGEGLSTEVDRAVDEVVALVMQAVHV